MIAEFKLLGTHLGNLRGLLPTGRAFTCRMLAIFEFESEGDGIVCERVYFDTATIQRQLGIIQSRSPARSCGEPAASRWIVPARAG